MCTGSNLLACGGFTGQLVVQRISDLEIVHEGYITGNENGITNALEIFDFNNDIKLVASNNDNCVRIINTENFKVDQVIYFYYLLT